MTSDSGPLEPKGSVIITTTCQDPETFRFPAPSPGAQGCEAPLPVYLVGRALSLGLSTSSVVKISLSPTSRTVCAVFTWLSLALYP